MALPQSGAHCEVKLMAGNSLRRESDDLDIRINELGTKSTQLLQFLSFAILGAATLRTAQFAADQTLVRAAIRTRDSMPCSQTPA